MQKSKNESELRLVIAGFGGQGLLTAGKLLCRSCLNENKNVTYLPSYGSEVRGGTANCHVVISDKTISSPSVDNADAMIILNELSMARFADKIKEHGLLLLNSSLIDMDAHTIRTDNVFAIPATQLAAELGNVIVANIIMLGAFVAHSSVCKLETVEDSIRTWLESKNRIRNLEVNLNALRHGAGMSNVEDRRKPSLTGG